MNARNPHSFFHARQPYAHTAVRHCVQPYGRIYRITCACSNVQLYKWTYVQMYKHTDGRMYILPSVHTDEWHYNQKAGRRNVHKDICTDGFMAERTYSPKHAGTYGILSVYPYGHNARWPHSRTAIRLFSRTAIRLNGAREKTPYTKKERQDVFLYVQITICPYKNHLPPQAGGGQNDCSQVAIGWNKC